MPFCTHFFLVPPENVHLCLHQEEKKEKKNILQIHLVVRKPRITNTHLSPRSHSFKKNQSPQTCYLKLNWECLRAVIMEFVSTVIC